MNKKFIWLATLLPALLVGGEYCYKPPKKPVVTPQDLNTVAKVFPTLAHAPEENKRDLLLQNRVFTKAFFDEYKLDDDLKHQLDLSFENDVSSLYVRLMKNKIHPSEKVLKSFYLDHRESFVPTATIRYHLIVTDSEPKAYDAYHAIVNEGKDFETVAKKYSVDPSGKFGGKQPRVTTSALIPPLRMWVKSAKSGDISHPIAVGNRYFIVKLDEKKLNDTSYEHLKPDIKELLTNVYISQHIKEEYNRLKKKYGVDE